jgi:hypothetical protein
MVNMNFGLIRSQEPKLQRVARIYLQRTQVIGDYLAEAFVKDLRSWH